MTRPNILLDNLPSTIGVGGKRFRIDTNFRQFIRMEKILFSNASDNEKIDNIVSLFFEDMPIAYLKEAASGIMYIYRCGEEVDEKKIQRKKNGKVEIKDKMIYDYDVDAPYIYAAFLAQYGIDLNDIRSLHWWKFQAMFRSLESTNKIVEIMSIRATDLSKIKDKEQRNRIAALKRTYDLPQNLSFEDKVAMAGSAFGGGFR